IEQVERLEDRPVVRGEENGLLAVRTVDMLVPAPRRQSDEVALLPVDLDAIHDGRAASAEYVIYGGGVVAVGLGVDAGAKHLNPAAQCGKDCLSRHRIGVTEGDVVERARIVLRQLMQRRFG